jgi:hypothetical protein
MGLTEYRHNLEHRTTATAEMLAVASRLVSGNLGLIMVARKPRDSAAGSSLRSARCSAVASLAAASGATLLGRDGRHHGLARDRLRARRRRRRGPSGPPFIPGQRGLACQRALLAVPIAGGRSGQPATTRAPIPPWCPPPSRWRRSGPRAEPVGAATGSRGPLPRSWGPGHRLPLVALMPQWRQNYLNNRPPARATAISAMGQQQTRKSPQSRHQARERLTEKELSDLSGL